MKDTQLRMGIIGVSGRGVIGKWWHEPEGKSVVVAGADILPEALDDFKKDVNPDAFVTADYREILSRDDIDAVAILTPDFLHEEMTIAALEAGKHVYCDKPMAITIEGCDRMIATAKRTGKKLMIGHNARYVDYMLEMKRLVDSGEIGDVKSVWVRFFIGQGSRYYFHDWHANRKNTTSLLLQKGCHDIDIIHFITGQYAKRVAAFGGLDVFGGDEDNGKKCGSCERADTCTDVIPPDQDALAPKRQMCVFRKEVDVGDNYVVMMELENGIKVCYTQCHFAPQYSRNYTFIGPLGRIENSEIDEKIWTWKRRPYDPSRIGGREPDQTIDVSAKAGDRYAIVGHGGADQKIMKDFVNMILEDSEPPVPLLAARNAVAVGVLAQQSCDQGGKVFEMPAVGEG